jgi:superoxide reductase
MKRRAFLKGVVVATAAIASSKAFADNYKGNLNRLSNKDNPTGLEQKHVPAVEVPGSVKTGAWFDVKVKVGFMKEHPSTPQHWINMIKLLVNGKEVGEIRFRTGGVAGPVALFRVKLDRTSTLVAIENCNLHGTWVSETVNVKVV